MSASVCPYCRAPIEPDDAEAVVCPGCSTPHHGDCFEENGGCTIFGCSAAPAAEPKLSIGVPDLHRTEIPGTLQLAPPASIPPPPPFVGSANAPPPPMPEQTPLQATTPSQATSGLNLAGFPFLTRPLPNQGPDAPPLFSSLGYGRPQPTPYPAPQARAFPIDYVVDPRLPRKNRTTYLLLGVFLGALGAHSFYAGSTKKGFVQLGITVLSFGFAGLMVWIWAIIDICTIATDKDGVPFRN